MSKINIRPIKLEDAGDVLDIYKEYIINTAISFEYEVPTLDEFSDRIRTITKQYPWLVYETEGRVVGYAYGCTHRQRTAYNWSVETAIYVAHDTHRKGVGKALYATLFDKLKEAGFYTAFAGMTMPNDKSEQLHIACGFSEIGVFKNIGYKFGKWHDVKWFQKELGDYASQPVSL